MTSIMVRPTLPDRGFSAARIATVFFFALVVGSIDAQSATAALREYRIDFEPSPSAAAAGYTMHIGQESGSYEAEFDLGNPPASGGTILYAVDLEDSVDLFVSLRAYDTAGVGSPFSNEILVSAVTPISDSGTTEDPGTIEDPATTEEPIADSGTAEEPVDSEGSGVSEDPVNEHAGTLISAGLGVGLEVGSLGAIQTVLADGSRRWLTVDSLAERGLRPARCDLDADGDRDLVLGFGSQSGAQLAVIHLEAGEVVAVETLVTGPKSYRDGVNGETHPACGDLDGDGWSEIVVGFGESMAGRVQVLDDERSGYAPMRTSRTDAEGYLQIPAPNRWQGPILPAVGDIDGDGLDELVAGYGRSSKAQIVILDDARADFAVHPGNRTGKPWVQVLPAQEWKLGRELSAPALGDLDGDGADEIAISFGFGSQGRIAIVDDLRRELLNNSEIPIFLLTAGRPAYRMEDGATRSSFGDIDGDGIEELVVSFLRAGAHELQVFDDFTQGPFQPMTDDGGFISASDPGIRWYGSPER